MIVVGMIGRGSVCSVDVGDARGWNVWQLENGDWAWNAWIAAILGLPRSGVEATEAEAQQGAQQEIERMLSEARAAAQPRRELPMRDDPGKEREPQS
jgi:hypothetical protein